MMILVTVGFEPTPLSRPELESGAIDQLGHITLDTIGTYCINITQNMLQKPLQLKPHFVSKLKK